MLAASCLFSQLEYSVGTREMNDTKIQAWPRCFNVESLVPLTASEIDSNEELIRFVFRLPVSLLLGLRMPARELYKICRRITDLFWGHTVDSGRVGREFGKRVRYSTIIIVARNWKAGRRAITCEL